MTYLVFHLIFILPPIAALIAAARRDGGSLAGRLQQAGSWGVRALALIVLLALFYTTPWDNYLIARGIWGYPPGRVLFTIGYVPFEEYLFFILQPILSGLFLFFLARRAPSPNLVSAQTQRIGRWLGTAFFLGLAVTGTLLLQAVWGTYFGLILVWAAPIAALQWAVGGEELIAEYKLVLPAIIIPTLYLWFSDWAAIKMNIWWISPAYTTGFNPLGLPVEEAFFFLITNIIVIQGLALFLILGPRLAKRWTR